MYVCIYIYIYILQNTDTHVHTDTYLKMFANMPTHIQIPTHIRTKTHAYTLIPGCRRPLAGLRAADFAHHQAIQVLATSEEPPARAYIINV